MADRIAVMREGAIVQLGTGEEIYRNPATRYVADFIGEANLLDCDVAADGSVSLAGGGPSLPYRTGSQPNGKAWLMVRPEAISLGSAADPASHVSIGATLKEKAFVGATWRCYLALAGGQEVTAAPGDSAAVERLSSGEATLLSWRREAGRLLSG